MIDIIVPTFKRASKLEAFTKNVHENTTVPHTLSFVTEPDDQPSIDEIKRLGENLIISEIPGFHTGAANTGYLKTKEPYLIIANDDFNFHKDWDTLALKEFEGPIMVCGLNNGNGHSGTIFLIKREYIEKQGGTFDEPNTVFYSGYHHCYVDDEMRNTALKRGVYSQCPESIVEHMHFSFNKSELDDTYKKAGSFLETDRELYYKRSVLWL